jgi:membrane-bound lytic murein transglycosylase D
MKTKLIPLIALSAVWLVLLQYGAADVRAAERPKKAASVSTEQGSQSKLASRDLADLSEREKWKLAREAYDRARREEKHKDTESAAYYYEATLELLGNLNLASIDLPTHRVLEFQRKVLKSYDQFLASIDTLPSSAGPTAVLEAPDSTSGSEDEDNVSESTGDKDIKPLPVDPGKPPLPRVPLDINGRVAGQINFFTNKGRKVMMRWMERAAYVFPRIRPILQDEGIPEEVMYLAMIESGLNPQAYSYAHAAGIWQFIPSTGRIFGLDVDRTYDERLHLEEATRAACRYLRALYEEFGDWYLVFAAYNCGEARVEKEIQRSRTRDYWGLSRLPRQTRNYVPAYLATRSICEDPVRFGFPKRPEEIPFACENVWVDDSYRLEDIAHAAGCDEYLTRDLNPEYVRGVTPGKRKTLIRLPGKPRDGWEAQIASMPRTVLPEIAVHKVRKGETLKTIARKYGVSVDDIRSLAQNRRLSNKLKAGQTITIPLQITPNAPPTQVASAQQVPLTADAKTAATKPESAVLSHEIIYTVHRGESIGQIARQLGIDPAEICRQNVIKNPSKIYPGQKLKITVQGGPLDVARQGAVKKDTYTVQPGDTIYSIARKTGLDAEQLLDWNKLHPSSKIYPGQELIISQQ